MFHTIYQRPAQRMKGSGNFWPIIILVSVVLIAGVYIATDGAYIAIGPSPLLVILIWRLTRNQNEAINFYVSRNENSDFEYGYKDSGNRQFGPYPIEEFTYWYREGSSASRGWNYDLYLQFNTKTSSVYLKEKIVAQTPPKGWTRSAEEIKDGDGVFHATDLVKLASEFEKVN